MREPLIMGIETSGILCSIAWWQNEGGNPIQWNKQIISSNFSFKTFNVTRSYSQTYQIVD